MVSMAGWILHHTGHLINLGSFYRINTVELSISIFALHSQSLLTYILLCLVNRQVYTRPKMFTPAALLWFTVDSAHRALFTTLKLLCKAV